MSTPLSVEAMREALMAREHPPVGEWEADYGYDPAAADSKPPAPPAAVVPEAAPADVSAEHPDDGGGDETARALDLAERLPGLPPGTSAITLERLRGGSSWHIITVERGNGDGAEVIRMTQSELQQLMILVPASRGTSLMRAEFADGPEPHSDPEMDWLGSTDSLQYEGHWVALRAGTSEFLGLADTSEDLQRWQREGASILFVEPPGWVMH